MAKDKKKTEEVKEEPRGKKIHDIIMDFYQNNNLIGFKQALKEKLGINELSPKVMEQIKLDYMNYALEVGGIEIKRFPGLIQAGKKLPKWGPKGLVISSRLIPVELYKSALESGVTYEVEMKEDLTLICHPIK
jgi:hypothetical protein